MQAKYGMELELMCVEKVCILMNYDFLFYVEKICFINIPILFEVSGYQVVFFLLSNSSLTLNMQTYK